MKNKSVPGCVLVVFLSTVLIGGCASGKYVPKADEELYGIWINENTTHRDQVRKMVYDARGWSEYVKVSAATATAERTGSITARWTDGEGNVWYKVFCSQTTGPAAGADFQVLYKLSKAATVMEYVWKGSSQSSGITYPSRIDSASDTYHIFYRKAD